MGNRSDIWHFLREHETPPPPELLQRIHDALPAVDEKDDSPSYPNDEDRLTQLQQLEIAPPAFVQASINGKIKKINQERFGPVRSLSRKRFIYPGIAASFFLLIGFSIYKIFVPVKAPHKDGAVVKNRVESAPRRQTEYPKTGDSMETATSRPADHAIDSTKNAPLTLSGPNNGTATFDGHSIRLVEDDPLLTFTSFHYPEIGNHMGAKREEEIKIRVDRYTNIILSRPAAAMIREMYLTRTNGKPTRRARKTKQKLEDWKRADEKRFDSVQSLNPTDPLELGEFIFK